MLYSERQQKKSMKLIESLISEDRESFVYKLNTYRTK